MQYIFFFTFCSRLCCKEFLLTASTMNNVQIVLVLFAFITTIYAGNGNYNQAELMRAQDPKSLPVATRRWGGFKVISTFKICNKLLVYVTKIPLLLFVPLSMYYNRYPKILWSVERRSCKNDGLFHTINKTKVFS